MELKKDEARDKKETRRREEDGEDEQRGEQGRSLQISVLTRRIQRQPCQTRKEAQKAQAGD